ncbi:hypothetical protein MML48_1g09236 [Holotrichia oblita]|uniref:Uncharacterized protein n=1 Tax=Holotrichia oblita TaxID=644536 RepID=A0ACB9TUZ7_HOLOL|nr:hypothetical protein MML48_1g09236 [Holotrichia oblita]
MFFGRRISSTITCIRSYSLDLANENKSFEDKFTAVEKERILTTLNSSNSDALSKFNITQGRLKNLINWKNKKGPFTTLSDVLEVDGLGINILDKLCQSILSNEEIDSSKQKNLVVNKSKKNILLPNLNKKETDNLTSAVGLHIESTGISWAKLQTKNNELVSWSYSNFSTLPKKVLPVDTFSLVC